MRKYCADKDFDLVIRRLLQQGWGYQRGGKHGKLTHPSLRRPITVSISPSGRRSLQRFKQTVLSTHNCTGVTKSQM